MAAANPPISDADWQCIKDILKEKHSKQPYFFKSLRSETSVVRDLVRQFVEFARTGKPTSLHLVGPAGSGKFNAIWQAYRMLLAALQMQGGADYSHTGEENNADRMRKPAFIEIDGRFQDDPIVAARTMLEKLHQSETDGACHGAKIKYNSRKAVYDAFERSMGKFSEKAHPKIIVVRSIESFARTKQGEKFIYTLFNALQDASSPLFLISTSKTASFKELFEKRLQSRLGDNINYFLAPATDPMTYEHDIADLLRLEVDGSPRSPEYDTLNALLKIHGPSLRGAIDRWNTWSEEMVLDGTKPVNAAIRNFYCIDCSHSALHKFSYLVVNGLTHPTEDGLLKAMRKAYKMIFPTTNMASNLSNVEIIVLVIYLEMDIRQRALDITPKRMFNNYGPTMKKLQNRFVIPRSVFYSIIERFIADGLLKVRGNARTTLENQRLLLLGNTLELLTYLAEAKKDVPHAVLAEIKQLIVEFSQNKKL